MTTPRSAIILVAAGLIAAGCGGGDGGDNKSSVSADDRIAACLDKQPDASESDCEGWEKDGKLADDGAHEDHESMGG